LALTYEGKEADHRVLCFYRGEEQSNGTTSNPFKAMLHQTLIQEGLEPTYWDISQGLPPEADVRGVPWVIAWFQETEMKGAIDYINFMTDRVHDGSKVMLLGELNFLRELHQQRWLSRSKVNQLLNAMGLAYGGQWTQQQSLLRGLSFDQRYFKTSLDQVMQSLSAFRYIAEKHPNCKTLLKVKREDTKVRSSMVVATPFGLYVDSALLESSPRHPKGLLDLPKLVTDVLRGAVKAPP
jgi:hypothetical protein